MTKILARDPARRCKQLSEWPAQDRELWLAALCPGDVVDPGGDRARFSFHSNRKLASGYGRWLQWLDHRGLCDTNQPAAARITTTRVGEYIDDLSALNSTQTLLCRIQELHEMARVMDPTQDWSWFKRVAGKVRALHVPARPKAPRLIDIQTVFSLGQQLMATAPQAGSDSAQAARYRDGLIVAVLAARPLRLRNLAGLQIGHSCVQRAGNWWLDIPAAETKTATPISIPLPEVLSVAIDRYIALYRPILGRRHGRWWKDPGTALWLSQHGSAMTQIALYDRIVRVTQAGLGRAINPHFFRDCAATSVAIRDPDHVRIAAALLGHRTLATTDRFYIQAGTRQAVCRWQEQLMALRGRRSAQGTDHAAEG